MSERKTSMGRTVIHRTQDKEKMFNNSKDHPAMITKAWSDTMVNLHVLPDFGSPHCQGSQQLIDPADENASGWFWPPIV